jgi:hypothetical protein
LDILGVSEVCWNQFREICTIGGKTFIFWGRGNENYEHKEGVGIFMKEGVGILMTKVIRKSLVERHLVSGKLLIARFRTSIKNISIIQCSPPTLSPPYRGGGV